MKIQLKYMHGRHIQNKSVLPPIFWEPGPKDRYILRGMPEGIIYHEEAIYAYNPIKMIITLVYRTKQKTRFKLRTHIFVHTSGRIVIFTDRSITRQWQSLVNGNIFTTFSQVLTPTNPNRNHHQLPH